ncbi:MAG: M20/M25/M40 family metallo-hydrolase [Myxococcota bacterium]
MTSSDVDPYKLLCELIAIPSLSREEGPIATFLHGWLTARGVSVVRMGNNLVATVEGRQPGPTFLLNSHMDTVPAKSGWDTDPWTPTLREGRLYGLGSGDAKASLTCMACATARVAATGLERGRLIFAATCMEEVSPTGLEEIIGELGHLDAALVGEPTSLQAAVAQGGLLILEATAKGRTSHSARPHLGVNALTIAARDLVALDALKLERVHPFLGSSTANVTVIQGGDRHNVIPDRCHYTIDIRYNPAYSAEELVSIIDAATEADIRIRSKRLAPVETNPEGQLLDALRHAHPRAELFGSPTMSDWVFLKGVDAIKIGPGDSEQSHTPNESMPVAHLEVAVPLYERTVRRYLAHADGALT